MLQGLPGRLPVGLVDHLGHGKSARAVNADERKRLALSGLHLGEAGGVAPELLALRLVALPIRQPRNAVALQTPTER